MISKNLSQVKTPTGRLKKKKKSHIFIVGEKPTPNRTTSRKSQTLDSLFLRDVDLKSKKIYSPNQLQRGRMISSYENRRVFCS